MDLPDKKKFIKIYSNMPLGARQEIVLLLDEDKPITWNVAFNEINANTPLSKKILEKLKEFRVI